MKNLIAVLSVFAVLPVQAADLKPAAEPAAPAAAAARSTGSVARAQFTSAVQEREPVDKVTNLINDKNRIYFFSEIKDAANQKVTHRWEHNGKLVSEVGFDIGGDRWRVYSSKTLDPSQTGEWKVSIVDENGQTLGASTFTYESAPVTPAQPAAAPAAVQ